MRGNHQGGNHAPFPKKGYNVSFDKNTYHTGNDRLSSSGAKEILKSPAHYNLRYGPNAKKAPPTSAMRYGTAAHMLILEGEHVFKKYVAANPGINRRTKAGKFEWQQFLDERPDLSPDMVFSIEDYDSMFWLRDAVYRHPKAAELLGVGQPEVYYEWQDPETGAPCKALADWLRPDAIVDLKTCADASPSGFAKAVYNFKYNLSSCFYLMGDSVLNQGVVKDYFWIAAEKHTNQVAVYTMDDIARESGEAACRRAVALYSECKSTNNWFSYPTEAVELASPAWAR